MKFSDRLTLAFSVALKLASVFPLAIQYRIADFVSLFVSAIPNRNTRLISQNIQICFVDYEDKSKKELYHKTIKHSCYSLFELAAVWCWPADKILARISGENICDSFTQSKKGRVVIAPHLGNWELLNLWLAGQSDLICLYKPRLNSSVDQFVLNARSRNGATMLPISASGLRQLSRGLRQGKTAMILPDQRPKKNKVRVMSSFFGQDAPTTPLIHNLCSRIDCDVFLATIFRERSSNSFSLNIEALDNSKLASDQQQSLDYMNREIENLIRRRPEQYQWGYARFLRSVYRSLNSTNQFTS